MEVLRCLIVEKVEPNDRVVEWMTVRPIDTEDLRATGSFLEIRNVVFGKLLTQVEADHIEFGYVTHVSIVHPSGSGLGFSLSLAIRPRDPVYAIGLWEVRRGERWMIFLLHILQQPPLAH